MTRIEDLSVVLNIYETSGFFFNFWISFRTDFRQGNKNKERWELK